MLVRLSVVLGGVALTLAGLVGSAVASPSTVPAAASTLPAAASNLPAAASNLPAAADPTPGPTLTCPPALPIGGSVTAVTAHSLTISYWMMLTPPCGYDPPVTVTVFATSEDARQWLNPVAEAVSGPERNGAVTVPGLTPDTAYWFRFSAGGSRDPYVIGTGRTAAVAVCTATVTIDSAWNGGFVATIAVRNVAAEPLGSWQVSWRWPGGERIVSVWNGVVQDAGTDVTIHNASYNGTLPPGGSTTFGMLVAAGEPPAITPACAR